MSDSKNTKELSAEFKNNIKTILYIVASIIAALLIGSLFILFVGKNPIEAYKYLILSPYTTATGIGEVITKAIPLMTVGVGVAFAATGGCNNLGGEGQMYLGAVGAVVIATLPFVKSLGFFSLIIGLIFGMLFGSVWGGFAGFMKAYYGSNELIVTIMLNYISIQVVSYLVHGPLMDPASVVPQSCQVAKAAQLIRLWKGSRAHAGIFIAIACILIYWFVRKYTRFGYNLRIVGRSPKAAEYAGCNVKKYRLIAMILAGIFAGLAGSIEVFGVQYRLSDGIMASMGITGMVVALIGLLNPAGIVIAAVMMASLSAGAERMQVACGVPVMLVDILQGLIVLFILTSRSFQGYKRIKKTKNTPAKAAAAGKGAN